MIMGSELAAELTGWTLPATEPYEVGREKLREFAAAVGETAPVAWGPEAARAAGYADVVAIPTFAMVLVLRGLDAFVAQTGIDYSRVIHADQQFTYARPIIAGDRLSSLLTVDRVRNVGGNTIVTLRCEITNITDTGGEPLCTAVSTVLITTGGG
jgi:acyl dehydratase